MKKPQRSPDFNQLVVQLQDNPARLIKVFHIGSQRAGDGKYPHWDKLRHLQPPEDLSHHEWWVALKSGRTAVQEVALQDCDGKPFAYLLPDPIPEHLYEIDKSAAGRIEMPDPITNPETKDRYLVSSLIEEAITSSQLEGAATTRPVAKEMIRTGRVPRDRSERMILNNFLTMQRIGKVKEQALTPDLVFEIHRLVTADTLDDSSAAGRLRNSEERVDVGDDEGNVFHVPPPANQLEQRLSAMCDFANEETPGRFVHPVIRSIILHFWLAYDHPFVDGNGRTARALFYWSMLHQGYWLCEFISISETIRKAPAKYGRAFLYTETDDNDLTYFLLYHLDVIRRAINQLHKYVERKTRELQELESELRSVSLLNHRQRALIRHALRHPRQRYTIKAHGLSHNVVYQTARTDLLDLADRGLLEAGKIGRTWHFTPTGDFKERLMELG